MKSKFFCLELHTFFNYFNFENFPHSFETSFCNQEQDYYFCSLTEHIFTEIWFCFAIRGVGHLTSNFVTQMLVVFRLTQG